MQSGLSGSRGRLQREVVEALRRLVEGLRERGVRVEALYVFGSRVRGDWMRHSDIDVVVVSRDFRGMRLLDRVELIERIQWEKGIEPHIDALPYTPEELERLLEESIVLRDAKRYWVRLEPEDLARG